MDSGRSLTPPYAVDGLQIIQLLHIFKHYENRLDVYGKRGICYGFGYANAYALLLANEHVINQRATILSQLNSMACTIAERKLDQHHMATYKTKINKYDNILDYILITMRDSNKTDDLKILLEEIRIDLTHFLNSQKINGENAAAHLHAYLDNICLFYENNLIIRNSIHKQNARDLFDLLNPVQMTENGLSIHSAETFSGIFDQNQFSSVLGLFALEIAKIHLSNPIVLVLSGLIPQASNQSTFFSTADNPAHTIAISFNPKTNKWNFIDSSTSQLTFFEKMDTMGLSNEIMKEFCLNKQSYDNKKTIWRDFFIHVLMTQKKNAKELHLLNQAILKIRKSDEWNNKLSTGFTLEENSDLTVNVINNCLQEGSADEFKSLFSDVAIKRASKTFTLHYRGLIDILLCLRHMDTNLVSLLQVLSEAGISMNTGYTNGENALHTMSLLFRDNRDIFTDTVRESIRFLCHHGVDINQHNKEYNITPLAKAISYPGELNIPLIKTLLENRANPNILVGDDKDESIVSVLLYKYINPPGPSDKNEFRQSIITTLYMLIDYGLNFDIHIKRPYDYKPALEQDDNCNTVKLADIIQHYIKKYPDMNTFSDILEYYADAAKQISTKKELFYTLPYITPMRTLIDDINIQIRKIKQTGGYDEHTQAWEIPNSRYQAKFNVLTIMIKYLYDDASIEDVRKAVSKNPKYNKGLWQTATQQLLDRILELKGDSLIPQNHSFRSP